MPRGPRRPSVRRRSGRCVVVFAVALLFASSVAAGLSQETTRPAAAQRVGSPGVALSGRQEPPTVSGTSGGATRLLPSALPAGPSYTVVSQQFPTSYYAIYIASLGTMALTPVFLDNGASELVLYDPTTNSTQVIDKDFGGNGTEATSEIAAGHAFFLEFTNFTTLKISWYEVTLGGKISRIKLPVGGTDWGFMYGNATTFFLGYDRDLVSINATTLKLEANYTKLLPTGVGVFTVLPLGDRLYVGGDRAVASGGTNAFFGFLNLTTKKFTTVSRTIKTYPSTLFGYFDALMALGKSVYAGGDLAYEQFNSTGFPLTGRSVGSFFYRYNQSTGGFANQTGLLQNRTWGIIALDPWGSSMAVTAFWSAINFTTFISTQDSGLYLLSAGGAKLVNESLLLPNGYLAYGNQCASSGWYFTAGMNEITSLAQVVAIKT